MFKMIKIFIYLVILSGIVITFVLWNGGDKIRWFGKKSREVGEAIEKRSGYIGEKSDRLKKEIEGKREVIEEKVKAVVEKAERHGIVKREGSGK